MSCVPPPLWATVALKNCVPADGAAVATVAVAETVGWKTCVPTEGALVVMALDADTAA